MFILLTRANVSTSLPPNPIPFFPQRPQHSENSCLSYSNLIQLSTQIKKSLVHCYIYKITKWMRHCCPEKDWIESICVPWRSKSVTRRSFLFEESLLRGLLLVIIMLHRAHIIYGSRYFSVSSVTFVYERKLFAENCVAKCSSFFCGGRT